ncbi:MAG: hypothetical protein ACREJX_08895, partial [Polyangiaceae bacterium]
SESVSVLEVHGSADETIPASGGDDIDGYPNRAFPTLQQTLADWQGFDGCTGPGVSGLDPGNIDRETNQGTVVTEWNGKGADVELWMIQGGTHSPTLTPQWPEAIYTFLSAHPKGNGTNVVTSDPDSR